jgi:hypothetical protein
LLAVKDNFTDQQKSLNKSYIVKCGSIHPENEKPDYGCSIFNSKKEKGYLENNQGE